MLGYTFFHDEVLCADAVLDRSAGFGAFAETILKDRGQVPARHHRVLIDCLEKVIAGTTDRLMVQMPPGSAKSTFASVLFPAFWFACHPCSDVIASCHTASLAEHFGRLLRTAIAERGAEFGLTLERDSRSAGRFSLVGGSQYFAAGVRGPITGRRADLILIDDPIKSWADAGSKGLRDALYDWYRAELLSRLKPGGRVVLIMNRWHEDDLAGRLSREDTGWTILRLPALAEAGDPLGRAVGEALWPEWESVETLKRRRSLMGAQMFQSMYQQDPRFVGERTFKPHLMVRVAAAPAVVRTVRGWDLAATAPGPGRDPDWTVGLKLGFTDDARYVVLDVIRVRTGPTEVERLLMATAEADGVATVVALAQDPGQAGVAQVEYFKRALQRFTVVSSPEFRTKAIRAMGVSRALENGRLLFVEAAWTRALIEEMQEFPDGNKDDQVDALSRALTTMDDMQPMSRTARLFLMER